jgi:hypothetical protein
VKRACGAGLLLGALMWFAPVGITAVASDGSIVCNGVDRVGSWYPELGRQTFEAGFTEGSSAALNVNVLTQSVECQMSKGTLKGDFTAGPRNFSKAGALIFAASILCMAAIFVPPTRKNSDPSRNR